MDHRGRVRLQPGSREISRLHRNLARAFARRAIDPVALPILLIDHPVAHGGTGDIDDSLGRNPVLAQDFAEVAGKVLSPACDQPDLWLPEARAERGIDTIAAQTGHLRGAIGQNHIVDGQVSHHNHAWPGRVVLLNLHDVTSYSVGISRYVRLRSIP